ncbi:MAG: peptidyl-prolyl cis-trans isomerase [Acidobacteria bacterium]|nr:peptidyl-prolyl cis-trans isomerase [Acidobacteriota bacterium]
MAGRTLAAVSAACLAVVLLGSPAAAQDNPAVVLDTSMGAITIELFEEQAPISVANFLSYVDEGHYDGVIFHRVIQGFMIQGGRFTPSMSPRATRAPIRNEAANGLDNDRYTVAMARTAEVDSATDQFFINTVDNAFLNHQVRDYGYAVFGRVIDGTDVVDRIESTPVSNAVPNEPVVIESARRR